MVEKVDGVARSIEQNESEKGKKESARDRERDRQIKWGNARINVNRVMKIYENENFVSKN